MGQNHLIEPLPECWGHKQMNSWGSMLHLPHRCSHDPGIPTPVQTFRPHQIPLCYQRKKSKQMLSILCVFPPADELHTYEQWLKNIPNSSLQRGFQSLVILMNNIYDDANGDPVNSKEQHDRFAVEEIFLDNVV